MQQLVTLLQRNSNCTPTPNSPAGIPMHYSGFLSNPLDNNKSNPTGVAVSGV